MIDEKESQDDEEGEEEEEEVSIFVHRFFYMKFTCLKCSDWDPGPFVGIRIGRVSCVQICQDPDK